MLRDLAAAADMSAAKAHRYLVSFQRLGLVMQDAGTTRYDLGPAALQAWGWPRLSRLDAVQMGRDRLAALLEQVAPHAGAGGLGQPRADHRPLAGVAAGQSGEFAPGRRDALADLGHRALFRGVPHPRPHAGQDRRPMVQDELRRLQAIPHAKCRADLPTTPGARCEALFLDEVRQRRMARVVDTLLPGVAGFCAPVFDSDRRMVMGVVALGSAATFDARLGWGGGSAACAPWRDRLVQRSRVFAAMTHGRGRSGCGRWQP
jgi:hypothetical protein